MDRRMKGFAVLSTILVAFLVTLVAFARGSSALEKNYTLSAFTGIQLQLPLYGFVNTSADNSYSATINAVDDLVNQASVTVNNNLLTIALNDNSRVDAQFSSPQTIFISVPASVISSISVTGNAAINADGHTIDTSQQLSTSSSGSGTIVVSNASPAGVNSQANGQGTTVVTGNLGAVSYSANGQSDGYYQGNTNSVQVSLTGQSTAFVDSSASPSISGQAIGQSEVVYTQGSCDITAIGQSGCQQQGSISVPAFPTPPSSGRISVSSGGGGSVNTAGTPGTPGSGSSNTPGTPGTGTPGTPGTPGTGTPGYAANGNSATGTAGAAGSAGGGAGQPGTAGSGSGSGYGTPGSPGSPGSGSPGTPGYSYSTAG